MAKVYLEQLRSLIDEMKISEEITSSIETKHFFSGAALYANGVISISLSPVGIAFKLTEPVATELLDNGEAIPLRYFPKAHVKKGYALFPQPDLSNLEKWRKYFIESIGQA